MSGVSSEYLKSYNLKINFLDILENVENGFSEKEIEYLIHDYIEYWERWNKFNKGYSKLIKISENEYKFFWDICKDEYNKVLQNKDKVVNIEKIAQEILEKIKPLLNNQS